MGFIPDNTVDLVSQLMIDKRCQIDPHQDLRREERFPVFRFFSIALPIVVPIQFSPVGVPFVGVVGQIRFLSRLEELDVPVEIVLDKPKTL